MVTAMAGQEWWVRAPYNGERDISSGRKETHRYVHGTKKLDRTHNFGLVWYHATELNEAVEQV